MEYIADSLPSLLGAISSAVPLMQSQHLHEKEMLAALELHRQAIRQAATQHAEAIAQEKELFREGLKVDLQHHLEDIRLTIESARRENLRDVWAQKSRRAETLLIMSSLMLGGFFSLVVEGYPALDVWPAFLTLYTLFLATSFAFLFICLFLSMKYQARMNEYNIYKADQVYVCGDKHESFESYYACHCAGPARIATYLFYVGTLMLLVAAALLQFSRWYLTYQAHGAAILYVILTGCTFIAIVAVNTLISTKTREANTQTEVEAAESDAHAMDEGRLGPGPAFGASPRLRRSNHILRGKRKKRVVTDQSSSLKSYLADLRKKPDRTAFTHPSVPDEASADMTRFMGRENREILQRTMLHLPTEQMSSADLIDEDSLGVSTSYPILPADERAEAAPKRFRGGVRGGDMEEVAILDDLKRNNNNNNNSNNTANKKK